MTTFPVKYAGLGRSNMEHFATNMALQILCGVIVFMLTRNIR